MNPIEHGEMKASFAHVKKVGDSWGFQLLADHLDKVAQRAGALASKFGASDWGKLVGLWHDLGKFHPAWQAYLARESGYDEDAHVEGFSGRPNHSTAGAVLAMEKGNQAPPSRILAYAIAGHHAGLPDWHPDDAGGDLCGRVYEAGFDTALDTTDLEIIKRLPHASPFIEQSLPKTPPLNITSNQEFERRTEHFHLWIRMLFSSLVDADFLDTEAFMDPEKASKRGKYEPIENLKKRFDSYIRGKEDASPDTPINRKRRAIRELCIHKAPSKPGFFSLTVPTGGGKTLSSMAFALEHAVRHGKQRIIVAIPYTSIIEQTSKVFKFGTDNDEEIERRKRIGDVLFGEDQVIEHHSNLDPEKETNRRRLACENWDAPIIVTTNVQLFESLFASRTSSCRKLHNIANSIIILDEVQMLPPEFLKPILSALRGLVEHFGVTVVMMTATQPALEGKIGAHPTLIDGIENVTPIIENPEALAKEFSRVEVTFPMDLNQPSEWPSIRDQLVEQKQVLCIVNSRKDCRDLHSLMPEGTIHLSALMCGEERSVVISDIKEKLRRGDAIRVISTQLVEAGVDIDFPVVYRALAGFDSIAQAAGRCNRENRLAEAGKKGNVIVFVPPKPAPRGLLRKGEDACKEILRNHDVRELSPSMFQKYFRHFYSVLNDVDKPRFYDRLVRNAGEFEFQFRTLAQNFNLIEENQKSIVIWYENPKTGKSSHQLIDLLRKNGPDRWITRKLQRFLVNVHLKLFDKIRELGFVEEVAGYWVQNSGGIYKPGIGLVTDDNAWLENSVI
jgi:CRISPR-associated endonuclease/helicase Cas3